MRPLLFSFVLALILISCSKDEPTKPSTEVNNDYLAFYYKLPTDSTYLNFRLVFTDTIPAGSTVYPRVYTKERFVGDTIFVCILNKAEDTIYSETSVGYVGHQLDMVPLKPNSTMPFHGFAFYIKSSTKVPIFDRYFIMK